MLFANRMPTFAMDLYVTIIALNLAVALRNRRNTDNIAIIYTNGIEIVSCDC